MIVMGIIVLGVLIVLLMGWKTMRTHKAKKKALIHALEEMDRKRQDWRGAWLVRVQTHSTSPEQPDLVQQVKVASASLIASTQTAAQDWGWGDAVDVVLLYEWAFEKAVGRWVYAQKDETLSEQWQQSVRQWNAVRQEMNLTASSFNASFDHPWSSFWMRVAGLTMTTIWMDEMEHMRLEQRLRNSLAGF